MDFVTPNNSDLRFALDLNADGNIAMNGETAAGQKNFTVKYFKTMEYVGLTLNTFQAAAILLGRLMSIVGGTFTDSSLRHTVIRKVE